MDCFVFAWEKGAQKRSYSYMDEICAGAIAGLGGVR